MLPRNTGNPRPPTRVDRRRRRRSARLPALSITLLLLLAAGRGTASDAPEEGGTAASLARSAAAAITRDASHLEREKAISILSALCKEAPDGASPGAPLDPLLRGEIDALARSPAVFRRLAAVRILASCCRPAMAGEFLPFLGDPSHAVRAAALDGIRNSLGARTWQAGTIPFEGQEGIGIGAILPLVDDPFWPVRRAALLVLAAGGIPGATGPMLRSLADPEPEVRRTALHFLGELNGEIAPADLAAAAAELAGAERLQFFKSALPVARPENASFFSEAFEELGPTATGLRALACAVAAGDGRARRRLIVNRLAEVIGVSVDRSGETETAADILLGWAAAHHGPALAVALEEATFSGAIPARSGVRLLTAAFGIGAVPLIGEWADRALRGGDDDDLPEHAGKIVDACLAEISFGYTPQGAAALAGLLPRLDGKPRRRAVSTAALFVGECPLPALLEALADCVKKDPPDVVSPAFGALCRLEQLPAAIAVTLIERFRAEEEAAARKTFALQLVDAARGARRDSVARVLIEEVERALPAAVTAGASFHAIADAGRKTRCAAALIALHDASPDGETREDILIALVRLQAPGTEDFIVAKTEALLEGGSPGGVARLATILGAFDGDGVSLLLRRLARHENGAIGTRAIRSLMMRGDPAGIDILEEVYPSLRSGTRISLLAGIAESGRSLAAAPFLERTITAETDADVLRDAIEALAPPTAVRLAPRLLEIASEPVRFGPEAAEAAIFGLARGEDPQALYRLKVRLRTFQREARTAGESFFDMEDPGTIAALATVRALALCGDPEAPSLLTGLLFQHRRARRGRDILSGWSDDARGAETIEDHEWLVQILSGLFVLPDPVIEGALGDELDALAATGDLYLIGDASFCLLYRELLRRDRCPRLRDRLETLVFQCRPDHSPAEFRLCVVKGDRALALGDRESAARAYMRARFIARFNPPSKRVVRQILQTAMPIEGHEPFDTLHSEGLLLLAAEAEKRGRPHDAARLRESAMRRIPFLRRLPVEPPRTVGDGMDR